MPPCTARRGFFCRIPHFLAVSLALAIPAGAVAQGPSTPPTLANKVRIGLPSGTADGGRMRQGAWAPIYITLTGNGPKGNGQADFKVVLDALDAEENPYRYSIPVPALEAAEQKVVIGYLRAPNQEFTVSVQTPDGKTVQGPFKQMRAAEAEPLRPIIPLFVVIGGASLPKLKASLLPDPAKPGEGDDVVVETTVARGYARITKVADMPDQWFGYDAADVIILTTDNDTFMNELIGKDAAPRRRALAEWVRRGGKLVLSVGRNHQAVGTLLDNMPLPEIDRMPLLPFKVRDSVQRARLPELTTWAGVDALHMLGDGSDNGVQVAKLVPPEERRGESGLGEGVRVLVAEKETDKDPESRPIIVEAPCGLGRVILIAFDVDTEPFTKWQDNGLGATPLNQPQRKFWVKLREHISQLFNPNDIKKHETNYTGADSPELMLGLQQYIDTFEDVPVVSFGWVAAFIFLYILIVGPLDYLILKKVFKRLELTWVTFPTVVVTISIGAYFIAYALKGDDLRVNKVDIVEIDLHTPQAYGTSWFSVFSPRMQNYTLGVEPALSGGSARGQGPSKAKSVVSLMENPAAAARGGSTSLFRQPYEYANDAAGIEHVPIPVWSTRMFTASWRTPIAADKPPIEAELKRAKNGVVTGKIINNLPVDLEDVCLFYHDHWYPLPKNRNLAANGDLFEVADLNMTDVGGRGQPMDSWFKSPLLTVNRQVTNPSRRHNWDAPMPLATGPTWTEKVKEIMFYREKSTVTNALNSGLRPVNQSWRLNAPDEVILVARAPYASGKAAKVNGEGLVQLWNDKLPSSGEPCPALTGYLNQETYVRVYIPVTNQ